MMRKLLALLAITSLTACDLAPELQSVLPEMPQAFKEAPQDIATPIAPVEGEELGTWKIAEPADDKDKGKWWMIFESEELNALVEQAMAANPSLKAAVARVDQARAMASAEGAGLWPSVGVDASAARNETTNANFPGATSPRNPPQNFYSMRGTISYEIDVFGKVRNRSLAAELLADAEDATYQNTVLLLQAEVAQTYFALRALDEEIRTLKDSVTLGEEADALMQKRLTAGMSSALDAARVTADLAATRSQLLAVERQRRASEHALATLLGKLPAEFSFAAAPLQASDQPPTIPAGLPSTLLERRPDVAAAQRKFAAANATIGVANAAFFPSISLSGSGGVESAQLGNLFQWSSRTWSIGPSISIPIFEGGRNFANLDRVNAAYEEAVANYRAQVLVAFREVEDGLSNTQLLSAQQAASSLSARASSEVRRLANLRYDTGDLNSFEVLEARRASLAAERADAQVRGARYIATVQLIRALGGGW
jgi:outer membrane protein, multidrug efflux system